VCCVLCGVCCVLCAVCCVLCLCGVCCVLCLCAVCCVLCAVCCMLCAVCCVLCCVLVLCAVSFRAMRRCWLSGSPVLRASASGTFHTVYLPVATVLYCTLLL
jgi:ABC-type spermidine/putrescine transport system permease subunit II